MHVREVLSRGTNKESLKVMVEKCRSEDKGKFKGGSAVANAVERREGGGGGGGGVKLHVPKRPLAPPPRGGYFI